MCWQCCHNKPDKYLKIFETFKPRGWHFGLEFGPGVFEFELEGDVYHTNPRADISYMGEVLPGEYDADGEPWFIKGPADGQKLP
jgi:hypothetical protein